MTGIPIDRNALEREVAGLLRGRHFPAGRGDFVEGRLAAIDIVSRPEPGGRVTLLLEIRTFALRAGTGADAVKAISKVAERVQAIGGRRARAAAALALARLTAPRVTAEDLAGIALVLVHGPPEGPGRVEMTAVTDRHGRASFGRVPSDAVCRVLPEPSVGLASAPLVVWATKPDPNDRSAG